MSGLLFTHPWLSGLLGDEEIGGLFTGKADLAAMLRFEAALAEAEAEEGLIAPPAAEAIGALTGNFEPDWNALRGGAARDGVVVPELLRQLRSRLSPEAAKALHFGSTSQDAIDASLAVRLREAARILDRRLAALTGRLEEWEREAGESRVMAHTRMQAARETGFRRKIGSWRDPLVRCRERLGELSPRAFALRFGGAVGDRAELGEKGRVVAERIAEKLGLPFAPASLHSERDGIAEFGGWLSLVAGSLGKLGQDVALGAQSEVCELRLAGGGGSSAMPHKSNPVPAEALVALARFNAALLGGLHQALVHENERSGAAWTLEWMILPQMTVAAGAATGTAADLLGRLSLAR